MENFTNNFGHRKISLELIKKATNNFSPENLIGEGGFGKIYRGNLEWSGEQIDIAARKLHYDYGQGDMEFWHEISMLADQKNRLEHENLVSFIGFCDEKGEKIIINKLEANGSLDKHLDDPTKLNWMKRLEICVGVARALNHIHNYHDEYDFSVIHGNIKSSKILLDDNWKPKLSGFEHSMTDTIALRHRTILTTEIVGTIGYMDPRYEKYGRLSHKSEIYSFGVILFEVLCGKRAFVLNDPEATQANTSSEEKSSFTRILPSSSDLKPSSFSEQQYWASLSTEQEPSKEELSSFKRNPLFTMKRPDQYLRSPNELLLAPLARSHFKGGKIKNLIDPAILEQKTFEVFTETAYNCLKQQPEERPDIKQEPSIYDAAEVQVSSTNQWKEENLEHLKIPLSDIELATDNFTKGCIGAGGYGTVYRADLDLLIEDTNDVQLSKKKTTVAIKCIAKNTQGGEKGFLTEIELLSRCRHENIVSLLGFCDEGPNLILVYEHASNGSLDDYLDKLNSLTWVYRLNICIDIARGLKYLHTTKVEDEQTIIHRDIKSANILLGKNLVAKIADFGLSRFHPVNQQDKTLITNEIAGTQVYTCLEYRNEGKLKKAVDIYSFGVVLFEILSGKLAYDHVFNPHGIAHVARQRFKERTINEMIDPIIFEEVDELTSSISTGPNQDVLEAFIAIAHQCVAETQNMRPTAEEIVEELEKALSLYQEKKKHNPRMSFEEIQLATQNFSHENLIGRGGFGDVFKGEVKHANGFIVIAAKRHLEDDSLTWMKRLQICIDVVRGLAFLHGDFITADEEVIHRDLKCANILLDDVWMAKISDFGLSLITPQNQKFVISGAGTIGYVDPEYTICGYLTKASDMYSLGVILFEVLYGKLVVPNVKGYNEKDVISLLQKIHEDGNCGSIVFEGIKKQIAPESLSIFQNIVSQCLSEKRKNRPTAIHILEHLSKASEVQEAYQLSQPQLPKYYEEMIEMSISRGLFLNKKQKANYSMFSSGILLPKEKVWLSLGANRIRSEMISAAKFSYKNRQLHKWRSISESRFDKVVKMLDISHLKIKIRIKTRFLSPGVIYGVHLVFKFCDVNFLPSKPMYVNLTYQMGSETLHAYFATLRKDKWMTIELYRFLNQKEDNDFEVLLESFSKYYCGSDAIYVEGIEFRAIDRLEVEKNEQPKDIQSVLEFNLNMEQMQQLLTENEDIFKRLKPTWTNSSEEEIAFLLFNWILFDEGEKLFSLSRVNGKKCHMLHPKAILHNSSKVKFFTMEPSTPSRFQEVGELLSQNVFRVKCKIESQLLSSNTKYACFLVFKLSEKCRGLHYLVKVRSLLDRKNKEIKILYFRPPAPLNLHDGIRVPQQRQDGWMEVKVWEFNTNFEQKNGHVPMDLRFISYEGTMCGLIIYGLVFRPM